MNLKKNTGLIDLFCGIGGLSYGFVQEGFNLIAGFDNDITCKHAYEINNKAPFICKDVNDLRGQEITSMFDNKIKILVGCAPCQPFSSYSNKVKNKDEAKWRLLYSFAKIIEETKPEIISMENVPQLLYFKKAPVFDDFVKKLQSLNYYVSYSIVYCPDYGIPQKRKRLVLLASKLGEIKLIDKTHSKENYLCVKDVIGNLTKIKSGEVDKKDKLHRASELSKLNLERLKHTKEGGGWKDWPEELKLACHKKKSGKTYGSVYGRMKWNEPAPTMTTFCNGIGNGRFGHPEQDRAITLREAALFQTFPKEYEFYNKNEAMSSSNIAKHIGNAVPPELGRVIAKSIKEHLKNVL